MAQRVVTRTCIACRRQGDKREFVRIVRSPEGQVSCDATGRKPGRGAYVCDTPACFEKACRGRKFDAHLRCKLTADDIKRLEDEFRALVVSRAEASREGE